MIANDDRTVALRLTGAAAGAAVLGYALPGLAGAAARVASDAQSAAGRRCGGVVCAALGIEHRAAGGAGYALTFDDGPHARGTPAVLEILAAERVRATFFLVGEQLRRNPALGRELVAAGHEIGLHCDRHRNLLRLTPRQVRADVARAQATIEDLTGRAPVLYRPPYGVPNAAALWLARRRGWRTLLWSHWGRDWEARATPESIAALVTGGAGDGAVLLLHDADDYSAPGSWRRTAAALPRVLDTLAARGLEAVAP
jgi:peptidoglycan/xylan/chitin deacetylase (PgdA/CDA1 family)